MHIFLFILYGALACFAIWRIPFFRGSRIRPCFLLGLFGLRVATGCLHNWIAWRYFPGHGDVWVFFRESLVTKNELFSDFHLFLANNSVWAYMPYNTIEVMHAVFDVFSFDNLAINTLFFSFFVFAGSIALFRLFRDIFPGNLLCAGCTLVMPSTLFWTACIHKEGLLYLLLGFFYYHFYKGIKNGWTPGKALLCFFLFLAAVFFRANTVVTVLPALLIGLAAGKWPARKIKIFFSGLAVTLVLLFLLAPAILTPVLQYLCDRQQEFLVLKGNSALWLPRLEPNLRSFIQVFPVAVRNGFFEPLPGSGGKSVYSIFSVELTGIWLLIAVAAGNLLIKSQLLRRLSNKPPSGQPGDPASDRPDKPLIMSQALSTSPVFPFSLFCILFACAGMLLIGYTVPFAGTIVRYRSIYLPFLLAPFLYSLRFHPVARTINDRLTRWFTR